MTQTLNARIPDARPANVFPVFAKLAALLELQCESDAERFDLRLDAGRIGMRADAGAIALTIAAENERRLYMLQQMVMHHLDRLDPALHAEWDRVDAGALPPNLSIATVLGITRISPNFTRVRVAFDDLGRYAENGLHFRLVISALPPVEAMGGTVGRWPRIAETGRTIWPEGAFALHRPVYTVREIDAAAGWMDFDVFLHTGGRVTGWTERAAAGDRIGLMGPTSLNPVTAGWVAFFGDETALPAIARLSALLPPQTRGLVMLSVGDLADRQDFAHPEGVEVIWREHRPMALFETLQGLDLPAEDRFVFLAAEGAEADAARDWLRKERGFTRADSSVTGYWRAGQPETDPL